MIEKIRKILRGADLAMRPPSSRAHSQSPDRCSTKTVNRDELAGDGGDDDFVRLPLLPQLVGEDFQVLVADRGDKHGLMQDASER